MPTTDEHALLAAITDAPLDDAPRLVYADWLQERGREAEAEYLRTVVTLFHPPEDPAAVARCVALAPDVDPDWRQQVGGRFEVLLEGSAQLLLIAHLINLILGIGFHQAASMWEKGRPVRLKSELTREDAEDFTRLFGSNLLSISPDEGPPLRLLVRPMEAAGPVNPIALPAGPRQG